MDDIGELIPKRKAPWAADHGGSASHRIDQGQSGAKQLSEYQAEIRQGGLTSKPRQGKPTGTMVAIQCTR